MDAHLSVQHISHDSTLERAGMLSIILPLLLYKSLFSAFKESELYLCMHAAIVERRLVQTNAPSLPRQSCSCNAVRINPTLQRNLQASRNSLPFTKSSLSNRIHSEPVGQTSKGAIERSKLSARRRRGGREDDPGSVRDGVDGSVKRR